MRSLIMGLVLLVGLFAEGYASESNEGPWERVGQDRWIMYYGGGTEQRTAHITLEKKGEALHFVLRAECKRNSKARAVLSWKQGDTFAYGTNCNGSKMELPTEVLDGWVKPLPSDLEPQHVPSKNNRRREYLVSNR